MGLLYLYHIGIQPCDLLACNAVPQSPAPLRAPPPPKKKKKSEEIKKKTRLGKKQKIKKVFSK